MNYRELSQSHTTDKTAFRKNCETSTQSQREYPPVVTITDALYEHVGRVDRSQTIETTRKSTRWNTHRRETNAFSRKGVTHPHTRNVTRDEWEAPAHRPQRISRRGVSHPHRPPVTTLEVGGLKTASYVHNNVSYPHTCTCGHKPTPETTTTPYAGTMKPPFGQRRDQHVYQRVSEGTLCGEMWFFTPTRHPLRFSPSSALSPGRS